MKEKDADIKPGTSRKIEDKGTSPQEKIVLFFIFALALLLRLLHVFSNSDFELMHDEVWYDALASWIFAGSGFTTTNVGPGYPYFLSILYFIYGRSVLIVQIAQAILSAGMCLAIFKLTQLLFTKKTAYLAGVLGALSTLLIYYTGIIVSETLFLLLFTLFALFLVKLLEDPSEKDAKYAGLFLGAASLVRQEVPLYFALAAPAMLVYHRFDWKKSIRQWSLVLAFSLLVILPWTIRNFVVTHQFIFISSQVGWNFWQGNNPKATGQHVDVPREMIKRYGLTPELNDILYREAIKFIRENPRQWLKLCQDKARFYFTRWGDSDQFLYHVRPAFTQLQQFIPPLVPTHWVVFLGLAGVLINWKRTRRLLLFYTFFAANLLHQIICKHDARYQVVMMPFFVILAAGAFVPLEPFLLFRVRFLFKKIPHKKLLFACGIIILSSLSVHVILNHLEYQKLVEQIIIIEGEKPFEQNFGRPHEVTAKKSKLLGRAALELWSKTKQEEGYHASYRFTVKKDDLYHLYIGGSPPGPAQKGSEWFSPYWIQVDDGPPYHLTEERMRIDWRHDPLIYLRGQYSFSKILSLRLSAGEHTLTVWVDEPRKHDGQYVFFVDAFILASEDFKPKKNIGKIPRRLFYH